MPDTDPVATRLKQANLPNYLRAELWDVYHDASNEDDLAKTLNALSVPKALKADLWDLKSGTTPAPKPAPKAEEQPYTYMGLHTPQVVTDAAKGAYAGALSTVYHGGDLLRRAIGSKRILDTPEVQEAITPPDTLGGKVGFYGEQGAEFGVPVGKAAKLVEGSGLLVRMGAEALASAGTAAVQSGGDKGQMVAAGVLGALAPPMSAGARAAVGAFRRAAAGAQEGGVGGMVAGALRSTVPIPPKAMMTQALKPRAVKIQFDTTLNRALPELKASEAALGKPIENIDDLIAAAKDAKVRVRAQYDSMAGPKRAIGSTVDFAPVADAITKSIPQSLILENPDAAAKILNTAQVYRKQRIPLDQAEQLLKETNAELEAYYNKFPMSQRRVLQASPEIAQTEAKARAIRDAIYTTLDHPGQGAAAREIQRRYGALMEIEDTAQRRLNVARRQQPESLAEQIAGAGAMGDMARGAWKLAHGNIMGAADIASARAQRAGAKFLKEQQTTDMLIKRAFASFKGEPAAVAMPPQPQVRGLLNRGPLFTPPPADTSYVRGEPGEFAVREVQGEVVGEPTTAARAQPRGPAALPGRQFTEALPPATEPRALPPGSTPRALPPAPEPQAPPPVETAAPVVEAPKPAAKAEVPASSAPGVSPNDIPRELANRAHSGTSFVPEKRGAAEQSGYVEHMEHVWKDLSERATTPERQAIASAEFERYRQNYVSKQRELLSRRGRMMSTMIAGPSNFPARRQNKIGDAYHKALNEFVEWDKRARGKMIGTVDPQEPVAISADRPDAPNALQAKIDAAIQLQERMRAANAIIRKKGLTPDEKVAQLAAKANIKEAHARELLKPDFAGRIGFADYQLTNNNANIRRMQARVSQIGVERATPEGAATFEGGRIEENADANRIQIFFDAKPDEKVRAKLKANGFKWAPSQGAWQRQRNEGARRVTEQIFGVKLRGVEPTPEVAHAAGTDAANRSAKAAGREAWNEEDYSAAVKAHDTVRPPPAVQPLTRDEWLSQVGDPKQTRAEAEALMTEAQSLYDRVKGQMYLADKKTLRRNPPPEVQRVMQEVNAIRARAGKIKDRAYAQQRMHDDPGSHMRPETDLVGATNYSAMFGRDEARAAAALKEYTPAPVTQPKAPKKVDTPKEAAQEVRAELERVVDLSGAKNAAEVHRRVLTALGKELQEAPSAAGFKSIESRQHKAYGGREGVVIVDGEPLASWDRYGKMTWLDAPRAYTTADGKYVPAEPSSREAIKIAGASSGKMAPGEMERQARAQVANALSTAKQSGFLRLQIPGDGTFTIPRNSEAIKEVIQRLTKGGTVPWQGLVDKAKRPTGKDFKGGPPTW